MTTYTLPEMPYKYDALEPHLDARTMEIHHTKHHQACTTKLNADACFGTVESTHVPIRQKHLEQRY